MSHHSFRYRISAALAWFLLAPALACSQNPDSAQVTEAILTVEDARFAAMVRRDTAWLRGALGDGLTYVHSTGRIETKEQYLAAVASGVLRYHEFTARERQVHLLGSSAGAVAGLAHARAVAAGQAMDADVRYLAVYQRRGHHWLLVAWQTTPVAPSSSLCAAVCLTDSVPPQLEIHGHDAR